MTIILSAAVAAGILMWDLEPTKRWTSCPSCNVIKHDYPKRYVKSQWIYPFEEAKHFGDTCWMQCGVLLNAKLDLINSQILHFPVLRATVSWSLRSDNRPQCRYPEHKQCRGGNWFQLTFNVIQTPDRFSSVINYLGISKCDSLESNSVDCCSVYCCILFDTLVMLPLRSIPKELYSSSDPILAKHSVLKGIPISRTNYCSRFRSLISPFHLDLSCHRN